MQETGDSAGLFTESGQVGGSVLDAWPKAHYLVV